MSKDSYGRPLPAFPLSTEKSQLQCLHVNPFHPSVIFTIEIKTFATVFFRKNTDLFIVWLQWVFVAAPGLSLVAVPGLLTAGASLVVEHRL